jgi:SH3-like domain-containing protein
VKGTAARARALPSALALALTLTLALLPAAQVRAATAYVSDELVLGVYSEQNNQGQRLSTLHSGASVETLQVNGEFTEVRLNDGTTGWVKSAYLTTKEPATVRVKQLEEELDRSRATTPELAEAAARSELEQLKRDLAAKQSELDAARASGAAMAAASPASAAVPGFAPSAGADPQSAAPAGARAGGSLAPIAAAAAAHPWIWMAGMLASLAAGFWLGYAVLARRVRRKFGGIKVY